MIHSFNSFDILTGVLKGDKLAQYMFIICLDQVLQTSINLKNKKMVLHFKKKARSRRYPAETITDTEFTDDHVLLTNTPS